MKFIDWVCAPYKRKAANDELLANFNAPPEIIEELILARIHEDEMYYKQSYEDKRAARMLYGIMGMVAAGPMKDAITRRKDASQTYYDAFDALPSWVSEGRKDAIRENRFIGLKRELDRRQNE
tara:strand:- start:839 stop:1207 length:369 start_codon:yes stop_codon:yes gene_type:complete